LHGGIEENHEGPQNVWHPAQYLNKEPTDYKSRPSHCTKCKIKVLFSNLIYNSFIKSIVLLYKFRAFLC